MELNSSPSQALAFGNQPNQIGYLDAKETFQKNTHWWTVFATFDLPDFQPSPLWIAKKTKISVEEVVEALEGLVSLGYLQKQKDSFSIIKGKEFLNFDWSNKSKAQIIDEHALVSQQILNDLHENTTVAFDHRFLAANKMIITELYQDIQKAFSSAFEKAQKSPSENDAIFKITFTGVDVLKSNDSQERGQ